MIRALGGRDMMTVREMQQGLGLILAETKAFLAGHTEPEELAEFQERVADRVLGHLQSVVTPGDEQPPTPLELP